MSQTDAIANEDLSPESLKQKTARGLLWGAVNNGVQQILGLAFGVVLGQILFPEDYGLVAMLLVFAGISSVLQESGFIAGLTQKERITQADLTAVFWFNVLCGGLLYSILFLCAPLIADFMNEPALTPLARVFFLGFLVSSFGIVPRAILFRQLRTKENAVVGIVSLLLSGIVGVTLAMLDFGYWALAGQTITFCTIVTLSSWFFARWKPTFSFDFSPLRPMFAYSSKLLLTDICQQINIHLMSVILGKFYQKTEVGYYAQGSKWTSMGTQVVSGMVQGVAQPTFARLQHEPERAQRALAKLMRFTAFVAMPALFGLCLVTPELIGIVFPDRWMAVIPYMQLLCIAGAFLPLQQLMGQFITAQGRSNIYMYCTVAQGLLQLALMLVLMHWGIYPMLVGYVTFSIAYLSVWHHQVRRLSGYTRRQMLRDTIPFVLIAGGVMVVAHHIACVAEPLWLRACIKIATAVTTYLLTMKLLGVKTLDDCWQFFKKRQL